MKYALIIILLCVTVPAFTQSCLPDGITFLTQDQIDNFKTDYPGCTRIGGSVNIHGDQIINLQGLDGITSVGFALNITNTTNLHSLEGLDSLRTSSLLTIYNNSGLVNLHGLEGLDSLFFTLSIRDNLNLISLEGLSSLRYTSNIVGIHRNPVLQNLNGLDSLQHIGGLIIEENPLLVDLTGMPFLNSIESTVRIKQNDGLK